MKQTEQSLAEQMRLHELEISTRKDLLRFTKEDVYNLLKAGPSIEYNIEQLVEDFYQQQIEIEEIALIIGDSDTLDRLRSSQRRYILDLFSGHYDRDYVNNRLRIGLVHKRIGVEPKHYLSALRLLKEILVASIRRSFPRPDDHQPIETALDKLLSFDVELVFDTYIRSLVSEIESSKRRVEIYAKSLEDKIALRTQELKDLSLKDPLTGLFNRRALNDFITRDLANAERQKAALSVMYIDLDDFKGLNDRRGHGAGDGVLEAVGCTLNELTRGGDFACRMGGDEFCVVLIGSNEEEATQFSHRWLEALRAQFDDACCTVSIGIATVGPGHYLPYTELLRRADAAMYQAKETQGSSVVTYSTMANSEEEPALRAAVGRG